MRPAQQESFGRACGNTLRLKRPGTNEGTFGSTSAEIFFGTWLRQQFSWVQRPCRIERSLNGPQHIYPDPPLLGLEPGGMIRAYAMVVTDRPASSHDRLRGGRLDRAPLSQLIIEVAREDEGEIEARAVDVGMADMREHNAVCAWRRSLRAHRV